MTRTRRSGSGAQVVLGLLAVFALSYLAGRVARQDAGPVEASTPTPEVTVAPAPQEPSRPAIQVATTLPQAQESDPLDEPRAEQLPLPPDVPPAASVLRTEIHTLPQRKKGERMRFDASLRGLGIGGPGHADTRRIIKSWRAAHALRAWAAWACASGEPERLGSEERRALLDLEGAYELRDLPDPLGPFLKLRPVPPEDSRPVVPERLVPFAEEVPDFPSTLGPWARAALSDFSLALAEALAMREDVANMSLGKLPRESFPAVEFSLPYALGLTTEKILNRLVRVVQIRRAARKWFGPGTRRLRSALLALGRSLTEEPESAMPLALLVARLQPELRHLWLGSASAWPRHMLLGRRLETRAGALVEAAIEEARREARGWMRLRTRAQQKELDAQVAELLDEALGYPGDTPGARAVRLHALGMRVALARRRKQPCQAVRVLRRLLPEVVTAHQVELVDQVIEDSLRAWLEMEVPLFPGAGELQDLEAWIQAHPQRWSEEKARDLWERFHALARSG
jgi:hypothetical protein